MSNVNARNNLENLPADLKIIFDNENQKKRTDVLEWTKSDIYCEEYIAKIL